MKERKRENRLFNTSIRTAIFIYFTVTALAAGLLITFFLYKRLSNQVLEVVREENQSLIGQAARSVESYLRTVMKLSDSLYYGAVKNANLATQSIYDELMLLYDSNKDNVDNIALFSEDGSLVEAAPAARVKANVDVTKEDWFLAALEKTENQHFSLPHVQYIFDGGEDQYRWVISLSRAVELTRGTSTSQGVLLVDVSYSSLEQLFDGITMGTGGYVYLMSGDGELLYHPKMQLIDSGRVKENHRAAAGYRDGNHLEEFEGASRIVAVKSIGYTGWKVVGVTPEHVVSLNTIRTRLFIVFLIALILFVLALINAYISSRITDPIKELEKSVGVLEEGNLDAPVYIGGSYEIRRLGKSIGDMAAQIRVLMQDIVREHEAKRKQEFDTLQSQINPHFLYNTLDSVIWMTENGRTDESVRMVTSLARLFRISLSKGKMIIPVADELEHARHYLTIQQMRYKNRFTARISAEDGVPALYTIKLVVQPILENAIYHGMAYADGEGEILIHAFLENGDLVIEVADNGPGMPKELADRLLDQEYSPPGSKGSGIGLRNVHQRIRLTFGEPYGVTIQSEPDNGTVVRIRVPALKTPDAGTGKGEAR